MTRQELTGERNLFFSGWVRQNLPASETKFRKIKNGYGITRYNEPEKLTMLSI